MPARHFAAKISRARFGGVAVLREPTFRRYYLASALESAGAALTAVALPLVVFDRTRSASTTAPVPALHRLAMVVLPATAAGLYGLTGPVPLFLADAVIFAVSAALMTTVPGGRLESPGRERRLTRLAADIGDGLAYLWRHRLIRSLAVIGTFNAVAGGAIAGILVVFADRAFAIHPGNPALGAFYVAASVGSLLGGASLPVLRQRFRVVTVTLVSLVVSTVLMGLIGTTSRK